MMSLRRFLVGLTAPRDRRIAARREAERVRSYFKTATAGTTFPNVSDLLGPDGLPRATEADTRFVVGTHADDPTSAVTLEREEIVASHSVTYGATGTGKTVAWLLLLDQELRRQLARVARGAPPDTATIVIEPKHDLAPSYRFLVEDRLATAPEAVRERVLSTLTNFNPSGACVVPLPLLTPEPDVSPELHATALSGLIGRLSGSPFGPKQRPILDVVLLLFILERLTLPQGVELLGNWDRLRALAHRSPSPARSGLLRGKRPRARLGAWTESGLRLLRLVFAPNLRAMFSATEGIDFDDLLRPGRITIMDLGGSQGDDDLTAFFSGLVMLKLGRAIRRRPINAPPVIVVIDEFQRVLQGEGDVAESTATFLDMARARGAALHLLTQNPSSVSAVSPRLLSAIHTNAAFEILGATGDPAGLSAILPVTGRHPRPESAPWEQQPSSPWLSREEELRLLVDRTRALPRRQFWVRSKRRQSKATLTRTLEFSVPRSRNGELARRIQRGRWGLLPERAQETARGRRVVVVTTPSTRPPRRPQGL